MVLTLPKEGLLLVSYARSKKCLKGDTCGVSCLYMKTVLIHSSYTVIVVDIPQG